MNNMCKVILKKGLCMVLIVLALSFPLEIVSYAKVSPTPEPANSVGNYVRQMDKGTVSDAQSKASSEIIGVAGDVYQIMRTGTLILILILCIASLVGLSYAQGNAYTESKKTLIKTVKVILSFASVGSFVGLVYEIGKEWIVL